MRTVASFSAVLLVAWSVAADPPGRWADVEARMQVAPRVHISGGWFDMGSDDLRVKRAIGQCSGACDAGSFAAERPAHRVFLHAYAIDRTEVSNAAHARCVRAGRCYPPHATSGAAEEPVVQLTWIEARAYCRFASGDLPTEAQWEYAARGNSARIFPWGDAFNRDLVTPAQAARPSPVESNRDGRSFFGLLNMAGNVSELVRDRFAPGYAGLQRRIDPEGPEAGPERVLRGGSFRSLPQAVRATAREAIREDEARADVGFRCAYAIGP